MNIDIRDSLTLDTGKEYTVISKITFQGEIHYLLVEKGSGLNRNIKLCKMYGEANLQIITDNELNSILMPLFIEKSMKQLTPDEFKMLEDVMTDN